MDSILTIVVLLALSAFSSWLTKKRQAAEGDDSNPDGAWAPPPRADAPHSPPESGQPPRIPPQPTPARKVDWEEQLRRLLEGRAFRPEPPSEAPVPAPPPTISKEGRGAAAPADRPVARTAEAAARGVARALEEARRRMSERLRDRTDRSAERAQSVMEKAQTLRNSIQSRTDRMVRKSGKGAMQVAALGSDSSRAGLAVRSAVSLVRRRATARQAVVASLILDKPRGLESAAGGSHSWDA